MSRKQITAGASFMFVLAFLASSALGADGLKTKAATDVVATGEFGSPRAKCAKGTKLVSGGFKSELEPEGPEPSPFVRVVDAASRGGRGWFATGYNNGSADGQLKAFAYCGDAKLERASATVTVPPGEARTTTAKCPRATKALSGGFDVGETTGDNPQYLTVTSSQKAGKRKWSVSANNQLGSPALDLTVRVVCRDGKAPKTTHASEALAQHADGPVTARCKPGRRVVSGGFEAPEPLGFIAGSKISASHKLGKRTWSVSALVLNPETVTAYAYCEKAR